MVENIPPILIHNLTDAINNLSGAIQTSDSPVESYLLTMIPAIVAMVDIFITIFHFNHTQSNKQKLEFMKQLEYYDTEFTSINNAFYDGSQRYNDCNRYAKTYLSLLDRVAFLKIKGLVNQDFIQFFESQFNKGKTLMSWLEFTNIRPVTFANHYRNFNEIKDSLDYSYPQGVAIPSSCYYYVNKFHNVDSYDPQTDSTNPKEYNPTSDDTHTI